MADDRPGVDRPSLILADSARIALALHAAGECWVRGNGVSMWPTIVDGDRVLVRPCGARPRVGDIVVIKLSTKLALHRVVRVTATHIATAGDSATSDDGFRTLDQVVARAVLRQRADGRIAALTPTLALGTVPFARWAGSRLRLSAARLWRRIKPAPLGIGGRMTP